MEGLKCPVIPTAGLGHRSAADKAWAENGFGLRPNLPFASPCVSQPLLRPHSRWGCTAFGEQVPVGAGQEQSEGMTSSFTPFTDAAGGANLVVALMGPTASGKTALALDLAEALNLAVISVDARQVYVGMDIGTAKPTTLQRQRVRHELLDLRSPTQPLKLQEFLPLGRAAIRAELERCGLALLVGGSGLYLQGLLQGLTPPAVPPQAQLRNQFRAMGQPLCHALLESCDPLAGARIAPADTSRTQRALEVFYATGQTISSQQRRIPPPWPILELGLDPADLPQRIRQRTKDMFAAGLVAETADLISRHGDSCPLLDTMGYAEARGLLRGEMEEGQAIALTEQRTRQYAKRQRTWFRRQHQAIWLKGEDLMQQALMTLKGSQQGLG